MAFNKEKPKQNDTSKISAELGIGKFNGPALMATYQLRQREFLLRITRAMTSRLDLPDLLKLILSSAAEMVGCRSGLIVLEDQEIESGKSERTISGFQIRAVYGIAPQSLKAFEPLLNVNLPLHNSGNDEGIDDESLLDLQAKVRLVEEQLGIALGQVIGLPLFYENELLGIIYLFRSEYAFTQLDWQFLQGFAYQAAITVNNAKLYSKQIEVIAELKKLDQQKSEFLSTVSHELRTPLTAIKSCVEGLLNDIYGSINDLQRARLEMALASINDEARLVENLLDLVRIQEDQVSLYLETENLVDLIRKVIQVFEYDASQAEVILKLEISNSELFIAIDRAKIKQVMSNLIHNAIKFSYPGGVITISALQESTHVIIKVADTGTGIPEDKLDAIFVKFYQVDGALTRRVGGTGIGLSIVKRYVEMHNGVIKVESIMDKGSVFIFTLPFPERKVHAEKE